MHQLRLLSRCFASRKKLVMLALGSNENMIDRSKDIADFDLRIAKLAETLVDHKVSIQKREYSAEAFGSWEIVAGNEMKKFAFFYDGQVSELRYRNADIIPNDYRDFKHKSFRTWEGEDPLDFVERILREKFPAG